MKDFGTGNNFIEFALNLRFRHAQGRAVQEGVLPGCEFGMEAGAHFQQAGDAPPDLDLPSSFVVRRSWFVVGRGSWY